MNILKLIASKNYIVVNKDLMRTLGIEEAILLSELAGEYEYFKKQYAFEDGWFYSTVENIEKNTTLSQYKQKKALDNLQKLGIVEVQKKGLPARRFIKINEKNLYDTINNKLKNLTTSEKTQTLTKIHKSQKNLIGSDKKTLSLELKKLDCNNNKQITLKKSNKEKNIYSAKSPKKNLPVIKDNNCEILALTKFPEKNKKNSFIEIIEAYTGNGQLQQELIEHIGTRKQKKAALTKRAIELSLKKLDTLADNDEEKILIVQNSIEHGWISFYKKNEMNEKTQTHEGDINKTRKVIYGMDI